MVRAERLEWSGCGSEFSVCRNNDMNTETPDPNDPGIVVDDDWKARVAAERAVERAAARRAQRQAGGESAPGGFPPASFEVLVSTYGSQALIALGLVPDPATGKARTDKLLAKHLIDMLGVIESISSGNLTPDQAEMLSTWLHQLRMAFVSAPEKPAVEETESLPRKPILELP